MSSVYGVLHRNNLRPKSNVCVGLVAQGGTRLVMGIFIAVDGPKHSGKSEALKRAVPALQTAGLTVLLTKEPTPRFDLANEQRFSGLGLARLIAQDRAHHLRDTIDSGLAQNDVVITDRYIASTLVFQVLDGVPFDDVWALNAHFRRPDLNVFLTADEQSVERRRRDRAIATRFDRAISTTEEMAQYLAAEKFMSDLGVAVVRIANDDTQPLQRTVETLCQAIIVRVEARHG